MNNTNTQTLTGLTGGKNIALWSLQILTATAFLAAGLAKLSGQPVMIESFDKIGLGHWFRYVTGVIEVASAVLLVSRLSPFGALLLICTMFGAIAMHLFVIGGSPLASSILLLFNVVIFLTRIERLSPNIGGRSRKYVSNKS